MEIYDNWWLEGENGDQEMEDSHQSGWRNVIGHLDAQDIVKQKVLDFGCNQGGFLRVLHDEYAFESACGIDLARKAIAVAQSRVGDYPITYVNTGDARSLQQTFNTVISTSVLYLIEDLPAHFAMIADILAENGVYYASFADQTKNPSFHFMKEKIDHYGATKMQAKTLDEVVDALVNAGFTVELRKEYTEATYEVTDYKEFYLSVDDYIWSCEHSFLIKATKK